MWQQDKAIHLLNFSIPIFSIIGSDTDCYLVAEVGGTGRAEQGGKIEYSLVKHLEYYIP